MDTTSTPLNPMPIGSLSSGLVGTAAITLLGENQQLNQQEKDFFNRLSESEQQALLKDCPSDDVFHHRVQKAMQRI